MSPDPVSISTPTHTQDTSKEQPSFRVVEIGRSALKGTPEYESTKRRVVVPWADSPEEAIKKHNCLALKTMILEQKPDEERIRSLLQNAIDHRAAGAVPILIGDNASLKSWFIDRLWDSIRKDFYPRLNPFTFDIFKKGVMKPWDFVEYIILYHKNDACAQKIVHSIMDNFPEITSKKIIQSMCSLDIDPDDDDSYYSDKHYQIVFDLARVDYTRYREIISELKNPQSGYCSIL